MNRYQNKIWKKFLVIFILFSIIIFGCKKLYNENKTEKSFTISTAKNWWINTFEKASDYNICNSNSEIVKFLKILNKEGNSEIKKKPNWNFGIEYKVGTFECIEFPLLYENKATILTGEKGLTNEQRHKIAQCKLEKIVLIKSPNGNIEVRILTITPTYNYLASKNFDITSNHSNFFESNFSGKIQIRKWDESIISTKIIENGKVKYLEKKRSYANFNSRAMGDEPECPGDQISGDCTQYQTVDFWAHVCPNYDNYSTGDIVNVVACSHSSGENTFICSYVIRNDGDTGTDDCSTSLLPYELCMCQCWGISYCDSGGDGETSNDETPCDIANELETNTEIKAKFTELRALSQDASNDYEKSFLGTINSDGTLSSTTANSTTNGGEVDGGNIPVNQEIDFIMHNHNYGDDNIADKKTYNIYSPTDMVKLFEMAYNNNTSSSFFFGLTTFSEEYMLLIENKQDFINFMMQQFDGVLPPDRDNAVTKLEFQYLKNGIEIGHDSNTTVNERKFLNFIKDGGLKFFVNSASNNNFNNWKPKKIDPNDSQFIINAPCN